MSSINQLPFKKIGIIIAILNLIAILNSANYFLFQAKFPVGVWLMFNVCAPSVVLFLIGFFAKRREIIAASLPFMAFFGSGGLFTFGWNGYAVISQIGHILMTCAVIYAVIILILEKKWKLPVLGFLIGLIVFAIYLPIHWNYVKSHPDYLKKLGDPKFEELMQKNNNN